MFGLFSSRANEVIYTEAILSAPADFMRRFSPWLEVPAAWN
jgi:hypothetical protein